MSERLNMAAGMDMWLNKRAVIKNFSQWRMYYYLLKV